MRQAKISAALNRSEIDFRIIRFLQSGHDFRRVAAQGKKAFIPEYVFTFA